MSKYCDPKELFEVWQSWMLSIRTPDLEQIRQERVLWSKFGENDEIIHWVATSDPFKFISVDGIVHSDDLNMAIKSSFASVDVYLLQNLCSNKFVQEIPIEESWEALSRMVYDICSGVALNFYPANEEIKNELIHDAFTQVLSKIKHGKLEFTPGQAPPFNLLTTAIFRIMYSIKNKEKRDKDKRNIFVDDMVNGGGKLPNFKSIEVSKSLLGNGSNIKTQQNY